MWYAFIVSADNPNWTIEDSKDFVQDYEGEMDFRKFETQKEAEEYGQKVMTEEATWRVHIFEMSPPLKEK